MAFIFEHRVEHNEKREKDVSGKADEKNPGRKLALGLGRLIISKLAERQKKQGKKGVEEKIDPLDIGIADLRQQQNALDVQKKEFEKRFSHFKEKEKETLKKLEPFKDEKRELLRQALVSWLTDFGLKEKKKPDEKTEKAYGRVLVQFDEHFELNNETPLTTRAETYLAAYTVLQQERIFKTEDQLNGTREQEWQMTSRVIESFGGASDLLNEESNLALALRMILYNKKMQDKEKALTLRGIVDAVENQAQKKILRIYIDALESYAINSAVMRQKIGSLSYDVRNEQECLSRVQEEHRMRGELIKKEGGGEII